MQLSEDYGLRNIEKLSDLNGVNYVHAHMMG